MEKEGIDSKTAWELYKKVDSFDKKLSDMKLNQDIVLKDLQSEQKKNHYEMLDAVGDSVKQYGKLMESNLTAFRFEIKSMFDDHERRLTDQEQKEMNNDLRLITVEKTTFDLPKIKETLACVDIRTANYNEIETTVAELVSAQIGRAHV